ncbi:hypothetical protein B0H15DRAFT_824537 [Mycena belliarum]|uniref:Uncharacterized protein n=1 Tax=Mycena belliarum TaxID=1033014 RepID=A0AAD6UA67_9AGAR|nr:hypothetical protein B0H15DRAFT_824537 [Mycena belliae]
MSPRPLPVPPRTHHAHTAPSHLNTTGPTQQPHGSASTTPFLLYRSAQRDSATAFLLPRHADRDARTHSSFSSTSSTSSSSSSSSSRSCSLGSASTRSSILPIGQGSSYPPSPRSPYPPAYAEPATSWKERAYIPSATVVPALLAALAPAPAPRARTASTASSHCRDWSDLPASSHVPPASYARAQSRSSTRTRTRSSDFGVPRDARTPSPAPSHASYSRAPSQSSDFDDRADACSCNRGLLHACRCSSDDGAARRRNATYRRERGWSGEWVGVGMGREMEMADVVRGLRALRAG